MKRSFLIETSLLVIDAQQVIMGCKTEQCIVTAVRTATFNHFDVTLVGWTFDDGRFFNSICRKDL